MYVCTVLYEKFNNKIITIDTEHIRRWFDRICNLF